MQINALRYRLTNQNDWKVWRFVGGTGAHRQAGIFCAEPRELGFIAQAFHYVCGTPEQDLPGLLRHGPGMAAAAILLSDNDGEDWILQREAEEWRLSKEGRLIPEGEIRSTLQTLQDLDPTSYNTEPVIPLPAYTLKTNPKGEWSCYGDSTPKPKTDLKNVVHSECRRIVGALNERLSRSEPLLDITRWLELGQTWESLLVRQSGIRLQFQQLGQTKKQLTAAHTKEFRSLRRSIKLGSRLQKLTLHLLEGPRLQELKANQDNLAAEIAELTSHHDLESFDEAKLVANFKPLLTVLTRINMWEAAIRTAEETRRYADRVLVPELSTYLDMIESELETQAGVFSELQSCLESLAVMKPEASVEPEEATAAEPQSGNRRSLKGNWFDRFKAGQKVLQEQSPKDTSEQTFPIDLETDQIRAYVSHIRDRITSLREGMSHFRGEHEDALARLDEAGERAVGEFASLKDRWRNMAHTIGLPDDLKLEQVLRLVLSTIRLKELVATRQKLQAAHSARTEQLELLRGHLKLYEQAQSLTITPADVDEDTLIETAKRYLGRIPAERKRYEELNEIAHEHQATLAVLSFLSNENKKLNRKWEQAWEGFDTPLKSTSPELSKVLQLIHKLRSLRALSQQDHVEDLPILPESIQQAPVCLIRIDPSCHGRIEEFTAAFAEASFLGCPIFLTTDNNLVAQLKEQGCRTSLAVIPPQTKKPANKRREGASAAIGNLPLQPPKPKSLIPRDTKEALQALLNGQKDRTRGPL